jgi:hypothetical protein
LPYFIHRLIVCDVTFSRLASVVVDIHMQEH